MSYAMMMLLSSVRMTVNTFVESVMLCHTVRGHLWLLEMTTQKQWDSSENSISEYRCQIRGFQDSECVLFILRKKGNIMIEFKELDIAPYALLIARNEKEYTRMTQSC